VRFAPFNNMDDQQANRWSLVVSCLLLSMSRSWKRTNMYAMEVEWRTCQTLWIRIHRQPHSHLIHILHPIYLSVSASRLSPPSADSISLNQPSILVKPILFTSTLNPYAQPTYNHNAPSHPPFLHSVRISHASVTILPMIKPSTALLLSNHFIHKSSE
jgi:hypothetical protein